MCKDVDWIHLAQDRDQRFRQFLGNAAKRQAPLGIACSSMNASRKQITELLGSWNSINFKTRYRGNVQAWVSLFIHCCINCRKYLAPILPRSFSNQLFLITVWLVACPGHDPEPANSTSYEHNEVLYDPPSSFILRLPSDHFLRSYCGLVKCDIVWSYQSHVPKIHCRETLKNMSLHKKFLAPNFSNFTPDRDTIVTKGLVWNRYLWRIAIVQSRERWIVNYNCFLPLPYSTIAYCCCQITYNL
jgi:hypothetical protein